MPDNSTDGYDRNRGLSERMASYLNERDPGLSLECGVPGVQLPHYVKNKVNMARLKNSLSNNKNKSVTEHNKEQKSKIR